MASKNASASSPVSVRIASARAGEVSGPLATMTLSHSVRRQARDLLAYDRNAGDAPSIAAVTASENPLRSTARAPPAGSLCASAARMIRRAAAAHFLVQQPDGIVLVVVGAEAVGTYQFGEAVSEVRIGGAHRAHLVQHDAGTGFGGLPCGFGSGEAGADDVDG